MNGRYHRAGLACLLLITISLVSASCHVAIGQPQITQIGTQQEVQSTGDKESITLFLGGDVMTGRGIDQVLPHPGDPTLHEPYMTSALGYVELAESVNGSFRWPVGCDYIWGDALNELMRISPDLRIVNLETSITTSDDYWKDKDIHYRMHPENIACLSVARIDFCSLANNHILDWGYAGLTETLQTLNQTSIHTAGAGENLLEAQDPVVLEIENKGRLIILSYGSPTSGIPSEWAASSEQPGVNLLLDYSRITLQQIKLKVDQIKRPQDIVVFSIHWGGNWGYEIPPEHIQFVHQLIDEAGVDLIHGHSSHHVLGFEIYKGKLILYGAGDLLNDYEGIGGYESFRSGLALMYFVSIDPITGNLVTMQMTPMQMRKFRLERASPDDVLWLRDLLNREGEPFGVSVEIDQENRLYLNLN